MSGGLLVVLVVGVALAPLVVLARFLRTYPDRSLLYIMLLPIGLACGMIVLPESWLRGGLWVLGAVEVLLLLLVGADLLSLPRSRHFHVERTTTRVASLGKPHPVLLTLTNRATRSWTVAIRDDVDEQLHPTPAEFLIEVPARSRAMLRYELRSSRRGAFQLACVFLRVGSRFGFWKRFFVCGDASTIHVYPDMKQLAEYALLARTNRLSQIGVRRVRRVGQDHEFERLRDYALDDNYRHIDWRSTARRHKLTVKDFQASQSQRIIFLLDCGRMMTNQAEGLSLLDHALNAALMLSYVALRQGDSVGLLSFSDTVHNYVPPRSGMSQMNRLLHAAFDRFPKLVESRYDLAFRYLGLHCRKRALIVLVTNLIDEVNSRQVEEHLGALTGRHLPLGVLLRDHHLFDAADAPRPTGAALYRAAAAADIIAWRAQVLHDLTGKGVLSLDVFPENLTAPLVNKYLNIKARHLL